MRPTSFHIMPPQYSLYQSLSSFLQRLKFPFVCLLCSPVLSFYPLSLRTLIFLPHKNSRLYIQPVKLMPLQVFVSLSTKAGQQTNQGRSLTDSSRSTHRLSWRLSRFRILLNLSSCLCSKQYLIIFIIKGIRQPNASTINSLLYDIAQFIALFTKSRH